MSVLSLGNAFFSLFKYCLMQVKTSAFILSQCITLVSPSYLHLYLHLSSRCYMVTK